jgi:hypothetical protein
MQATRDDFHERFEAGTRVSRDLVGVYVEGVMESRPYG